MSEMNRGKSFATPESIRRMRESLRKRKWVNNGKDEVNIHQNELEDYLNNGYVKGRLSTTDIVKKKQSKAHKEFCKNMTKEQLSNKYGYNKGKSNPRKGTKFNISDKQRESWSKQRKGRIWVHNNTEKTQIYQNQLQEYLDKGYHKGMYKEKCIICSSTTIENIS